MLLFGWVFSWCFLVPLGVLLVMKTLEDEQYVVIKAYKFTVFEIWRDFKCLVIYCMSTLSLHWSLPTPWYLSLIWMGIHLSGGLMATGVAVCITACRLSLGNCKPLGVEHCRRWHIIIQHMTPVNVCNCMTLSPAFWVLEVLLSSANLSVCLEQWPGDLDCNDDSWTGRCSSWSCTYRQDYRLSKQQFLNKAQSNSKTVKCLTTYTTCTWIS